MGAEIYRLVGFDIIADSKTLHAVQWLAWTDIVNSAAWIGVVIVLEIEVRLQLRGGMDDETYAAFLKRSVEVTHPLAKSRGSLSEQSVHFNFYMPQQQGSSTTPLSYCVSHMVEVLHERMEIA